MNDRIEGLACPACHASTDGYTGIGNSIAPRDGDVSICAYCRNVAIFVVSGDHDYAFRDATSEELLVLSRDPMFVFAREGIAKMHKDHPING